MVVKKQKVLILTILFVIIYPIRGQVSSIVKGGSKKFVKKSLQKEFSKSLIKNHVKNYKKNIHKNIKKEFKPQMGGSFKKLNIRKYRNPKTGKVKNLDERHHMPSCKSMEDALKGNYSKKSNAVAIVMKKEHHKLTKSYGSSKAAKEFRRKETALLNEGKPNAAFRKNAEDVLGFDGDKPKGYSGQQYLNATSKAEAAYRNWKKKYYYRQYNKRTGKNAVGEKTDNIIENTEQQINNLFQKKQ